MKKKQTGVKVDYSKKQADFLKYFEMSMTVTYACKAAGVNPHLFYERWLKLDESFTKKFYKIKLQKTQLWISELLRISNNPAIVLRVLNSELFKSSDYALVKEEAKTIIADKIEIDWT